MIYQDQFETNLL